jgi:hypothetical protein
VNTNTLRLCFVLLMAAAATPSLAGGIGDSVTEFFGQNAVCRNVSTGQTAPVGALGGAASWDCTAAGLLADPGDGVVQFARGLANCAPGANCVIRGQVTGVDGEFAVCRNLTTGASVAVPVAGGTNWDCFAAGFAASRGDQIVHILRGTVPGGPLPTCAIEFEGAGDCPDTQELCGVTFTGGGGCIVAGLGFCYTSGLFGYEVPAGDVLSIELSGDLNTLDVFFASAGPGVGTMTFFDATGAQVDSPIETNGDCSLAMPPTQFLAFSSPVRTIVVEASATDRLFIDSFIVNP